MEEKEQVLQKIAFKSSKYKKSAKADNILVLQNGEVMRMARRKSRLPDKNQRMHSAQIPNMMDHFAKKEAAGNSKHVDGSQGALNLSLNVQS